AASDTAAPLAGLIGAGCTALPRGTGLAAYRLFLAGLNVLPGNGLWLSGSVLSATLPHENRLDFEAGGYALKAQDAALGSLAELDIAFAVSSLTLPLWFVNGQFDQLRMSERLFTRLAPHAEL